MAGCDAQADGFLRRHGRGGGCDDCGAGKPRQAVANSHTFLPAGTFAVLQLMFF
jgi:hypothetical protein